MLLFFYKKGDEILKKYIVTLLIACVVSLGLSFLLEREILRNIGIGLLLIGIALSGTAVSGDRMRANQENSELGFRKNYFWFPLLACLPFFIVYTFL